MKIEGKVTIQKTFGDRHLAFGWASVAKDTLGFTVVDSEGDTIDIYELEKAAYNFVELYREGGEMHERGGCAVLIESIVFTPEKLRALGLMEGALPAGWWIGFKVTDEEVWQKVLSGEYSMFSIEGTARREDFKDE